MAIMVMNPDPKLFMRTWINGSRRRWSSLITGFIPTASIHTGSGWKTGPAFNLTSVNPW